MNDMLVLAVVLLLVASGYAAGRVHGQVGYRDGYRSGYRQGHADGVRFRASTAIGAADPDVAAGSPVEDDHLPSETRHLRTLLGGALSAQRLRAAAAHRVRNLKG